MFDDIVVEDSNCTRNGNKDCFAIGADYCSAYLGSHRVCCKVGDLKLPQLKSKLTLESVLDEFVVLYFANRCRCARNAMSCLKPRLHF